MNAPGKDQKCQADKEVLVQPRFRVRWTHGISPVVYRESSKKKIAIDRRQVVPFVPVNIFIFFWNIYGLMTKVTVYSTKNCPYCRMAKAFLEKYGVPYESIDVGSDEDAAQKMIELSGQRGVPVITVDNEVIVGFDAPRLNELFGETEATDIYAVLIVGAGPAGLTAAVYCARKMLNTMVISENIGGQALESWAIENYMGYRMISGEDLMKKFEEHVRTLNIRLELDKVVSITKEENIFVVKTLSDNTIRARALILTQGNRPRNWAWQTRRSISAAGSRSAPPATARFTGGRWWPWSAAATPHSRPRLR